MSDIHVFEAAGLGKAPFRVLGVECKVGPIRYERNGVEVQVGSPGQPMGCCAYCFTGIMECWSIRSADGKVFDVGCECVRKTGDAGLKRGMAPHLRAMRHAKDDARIEAARAALGTVAPPLRSHEELIASVPQVVADRDAYKAQRDALAGALRDILDYAEASMHKAGHLAVVSSCGAILETARAALAGMERGA